MLRFGFISKILAVASIVLVLSFGTFGVLVYHQQRDWISSDVEKYFG